MSWRDNLIDASFKNVSFKVASSSYSVGRRTALHQYANRETPYLEDLGREADTFTIDGYIIQNSDNFYDYFAERDRLIAALKNKGPGILNHPFLGIKRVGLLGQAIIEETFDEGGIAKFSMTFTEAGSRTAINPIEDFKSIIDDTVNQAIDVAGDFFQVKYDTTGVFIDNSV